MTWPIMLRPKYRGRNAVELEATLLSPQRSSRLGPSHTIALPLTPALDLFAGKFINDSGNQWILKVSGLPGGPCNLRPRDQ